MAVTYAMVGIASRGAYSPTSESDTTYVQLNAIAKLRLDNDAPTSLPTALYDWCHALLITHMAVADITSGYKSYSTDGFSASQEPGQSIFLLEYKQILESYTGGVDYSAEEDSVRADASMPDFRLDQADISSYYSEV